MSKLISFSVTFFEVVSWRICSADFLSSNCNRCDKDCESEFEFLAIHKAPSAQFDCILMGGNKLFFARKRLPALSARRRKFFSGVGLMESGALSKLGESRVFHKSLFFWESINWAMVELLGSLPMMAQAFLERAGSSIRMGFEDSVPVWGKGGLELVSLSPSRKFHAKNSLQ